MPHKKNATVNLMEKNRRSALHTNLPDLDVGPQRFELGVSEFSRSVLVHHGHHTAAPFLAKSIEHELYRGSSEVKLV